MIAKEVLLLVEVAVDLPTLVAENCNHLASIQVAVQLAGDQLALVALLVVLEVEQTIIRQWLTVIHLRTLIAMI